MTTLECSARDHITYCEKCSRVDMSRSPESALCQFGQYHRTMLRKENDDKIWIQEQRNKPIQGELDLKARRDPVRIRRRAGRYATWAAIIYFDGTPALQAIEDVKFSHDMEATWQTKP